MPLQKVFIIDNKEHKVSKSEHDNGCISVDYLTDAVKKKFKLDDQSIQEMTDHYDVIACMPIDSPKSNLQAMKDSPDYHNIEDMYEAIKIIHENIHIWILLFMNT